LEDSDAEAETFALLGAAVRALRADVVVDPGVPSGRMEGGREDWCR
jgi:hypothetical protein